MSAPSQAWMDYLVAKQDEREAWERGCSYQTLLNYEAITSAALGRWNMLQDFLEAAV